MSADPLSTALSIIGARALMPGAFSANDLRDQMEAARIPSPLIGRAFQLAHGAATIRRTSMLGIVSTQRRTHRKRIDEWVGV